MFIARLLGGKSTKFYRDLTLLAGGQVFSKVIGFLAFALLARALDPASYGAVEYIVALSAFFATAVDGGLGIIGTRRAAKHPDQLTLLVYQIPIARLILAVISIPVMTIIAYLALKSSAPAMLYLLFAASLLTIPWRQQWVFQATGRMAAVANADVVRMALFGAVVWLTVRSPGDVIMVGWAEIVAVTGMTLYCLFIQTRYASPIRLTGPSHGFGLLMREGMLVSSTNLIWALTQAIPVMLVTALLGGVATAWFAGAARITGSIGQFSNIYHFNLYPAVSKAHAADDDTLGPLLNISMRLTAWGGVLVALVLTIFAVPLVHLTLGEKMIPAAPVLQILAWFIPISLWSGHARWALAAAGAQQHVMLAQISGLAATVIVGTVAGRSFGPEGFAVGAVAGGFAVWMMSHKYAFQHGCHPPSFRPAVLPTVLAGAIIACNFVFVLSPALLLTAIFLFIILAPLLDRSLLGDVRMLGQIREHQAQVVSEPRSV